MDNKTKKSPGRPKSDVPKERATFIVSISQLEELKNLTYWARKTQADAVSKAFQDFIDMWKKVPSNKQYIDRHGNIKPRLQD